MKKLLIYGATGYTGKLLIEKIKLKNYTVIIAGRDEKKLKELSKNYNYDYRLFSLRNGEIVSEFIKDIDVVLNVAGPFIDDIDNMIDACIENKTHFIDLAMDPKELSKYHYQAKQADVMLLSGAGHAFLPLDCLGGFLYEKMPEAEHLSIYISGMDTMSRGTAKSNIALIKQGIHHRKKGRLKRIRRMPRREMKINDKTKEFVPSAFGIPTLTHSTGIDNIESYFESTPAVKPFIFVIQYLSWLFKFGFVQKMFLKKLNSLPEGPTAKERSEGKIEYLGTIKDQNQNVLEAILTTPEAYKTTYLATYAVLDNIQENFKAGFQTPYKLFGPEILNKIDGFKLTLCEAS